MAALMKRKADKAMAQETGAAAQARAEGLARDFNAGTPGASTADLMRPPSTSQSLFGFMKGDLEPEPDRLGSGAPRSSNGFTAKKLLGQ